MAYKLSEINDRCRKDPKGFIEKCDAVYRDKISRAADMIIENMKKSPIVLLSGPSGSGKTTTAMKIDEELHRRGVGTHTIAMDHYFRTVTPETMPRTETGEYDYESPACMDMDLLNKHFTMLSRGERVAVPRFDFSMQMRDLEPSKTLRLKKDEVAIFEGIHALNDDITTVHPEAFKLYISARSNIVDDAGQVIFKGTWMRLCRRSVRDYLFRGTDAVTTLEMWANVRRGEKKYISPFKDKANFQFDSSFPYEVPILNNMATELFEAVPEGAERFDELRQILPAFELFEDVPPELLAPEALLREFIGGGIYEY